jgi:hypothetical protein
MNLEWLPIIIAYLFVGLHIALFVLFLITANIAWIVTYLWEKFIHNKFNAFITKGDETNKRSNFSRYPDYIHSCLIVFGETVYHGWCGKNATPFHPSQSGKDTSNQSSSENINSNPKELGIKKFSNTIHSPKSSIGENDVSTKSKENPSDTHL